jgi:hypothetical protein
MGPSSASDRVGLSARPSENGRAGHTPTHPRRFSDSCRSADHLGVSAHPATRLDHPDSVGRPVVLAPLTCRNRSTDSSAPVLDPFRRPVSPRRPADLDRVFGSGIVTLLGYLLTSDKVSNSNAARWHQPPQLSGQGTIDGSTERTPDWQQQNLAIEGKSIRCRQVRHVRG